MQVKIVREVEVRNSAHDLMVIDAGSKFMIHVSAVVLTRCQYGHQSNVFS